MIFLIAIVMDANSALVLALIAIIITWVGIAVVFDVVGTMVVAISVVIKSNLYS